MKNKEITIYKLLGLIKNGKAPKKIIYKGRSYKYEQDFKDYYSGMYSLFENEIHVIGNVLNDAIKISDEENDEFEDIEEIQKTIAINDYLEDNNIFTIELNHRVNQLIRNQKKIIERLNKDE